MKTFKHELRQSTKILILAFVLSLGVSTAFAWTGPTAAPPSANTPAPVNVGATSQVKSGGLGVADFVANSATVGATANAGAITAPKFCIGTNCITSWPSGTVNPSNPCHVQPSTFSLYGKATVSLQCSSDNKTLGLKVQPGALNTCSYPIYTSPTFDSSPGVVVSDGGCSIGGQVYGKVADFVPAVNKSYTWKVTSGNGCDAGCDMQTVNYNGVTTMTFLQGSSLTPYGDVVVSWNGSGAVTVQEPPPPANQCPPGQTPTCVDPNYVPGGNGGA